MSDLFPGSSARRIETNGASLFARVGGKGSPLLLLHGFAQTHAMWHTLYPALSGRFTCVMMDLRGYGRSSCPPNDAGNEAYSKRVMAKDAVALMASLGFERFAVAGHDRGGRVAYRLALDHPERVTALAVLDIVPTVVMWRAMDVPLAMNAYHWFMLAQPEPLPEMLVGGDPQGFVDYTIASWTRTKDLSAFHPEALADYRTCFAEAGHVHGACNDYRAGATIDRAIDEADMAAGRRIACPTLALWGDEGFPAQAATPLDVWRNWCVAVEGKGIEAGHFIAEENPRATIEAMLPFLETHAAATS